MKLIEKFQTHLEPSYQEVVVIDERGDGHFVQVICIDPSFEGQSLLNKSRSILKSLGELQQRTHAISVKGFTPAEWNVVKADFKPIEYTHYPKP